MNLSGGQVIAPLILRRKHILRAQDWGSAAGTDYWAHFNDIDMLGVSQVTSADPGRSALSNYGWTTTALAIITNSGSGADFLSSTDEVSNTGVDLVDSGDLLQSPRIFGNYGHALLAEQFLGFAPTMLVLEVYGRMYTASANETNSGFGFIEDAGTPATAADHLAFIFSDSSNFGLRSGAASDVGAAVTTTFHLWRIELVGTTAEWFIDGTSQGTIVLETDEFPVSFGAHAFTTNNLMLAWVHIWYE